MAKKSGAKKKKLSEAELKSLLRKHQNKLLSQPNVNSVGIGYKDNDPNKEMCIQVTVDKKYGVSELEDLGVEPLPETLEGPGGEKVEIHVTERKYEPSYKIITVTPEELGEDTRDRRRSRLDPVIPGASVSHIDGSAGTIGAIVFDRDTGEPYVLSNWHVLQRVGGEIGDKVVQPGPHDDSETYMNYMGKLVRSHLGLAGDCAIASIDARSHTEGIMELGVRPKRVAIAELGDKVVKSGRTTGVTYGRVRRTGVVTKINYGGDYDEQEIGGFEIGLDLDRHDADDEVSKGGDSGSLWMINTGGKDKDIVVGLHFAGERDPSPDEHAIACNIHSVLKKLKVTFEPSEGADSPESVLFKKLGFDYSAESMSVADSEFELGTELEYETAEEDVTPVTIGKLNRIEALLESDPKGALEKMRDAWNDELTLEQARTAIARAKIALQNPALALQGMSAPELLPGPSVGLPPGFNFPGMDLQ